MRSFETKRLSVEPDAVAPDGSVVRVGLGVPGGGMAHFELASGQTSRAVTHRTVEEVWCFVAGRGEMWRRLGDQEETVQVEEGVCVTIPVGTHFQFRSFGGRPLAALAVTIPPWPGDAEAVPVKGKWPPTIP